jgi:hypothetical protein
MVAEHRTEFTLACRFTPDELTALAARLRARAETIVPSGRPDEQRDLSLAALVVEEVVQLHADMRESLALTDRIRRMLGLGRVTREK